ncbi:MAG: hypothetical protein IKB32_00245 [Clostridia bacterium]|nr:hypothetical protein [Clostridia bacterium]
MIIMFLKTVPSLLAELFSAGPQSLCGDEVKKLSKFSADASSANPCREDAYKQTKMHLMGFKGQKCFFGG